LSCHHSLVKSTSHGARRLGHEWQRGEHEERRTNGGVEKKHEDKVKMAWAVRSIVRQCWECKY
jgi:hypothetical protein